MIDLEKGWSLGFGNRGHDRGNYAVVLTDIPPPGDVVVECGSDRALAEHLILVHNNHVGVSNRPPGCECPYIDEGGAHLQACKDRRTAT